MIVIIFINCTTKQTLTASSSSLTTPPKVSIVIPIYNKAHYLPKALDSAINQSLRDIEIICIDDGSTDESAKIVQEYALKDKRIKLIKLNRNRGLLFARTFGIKNSNGDYILNLDADDELCQEIAEKAYNLAQEKSADIVHFKCYIILDDQILDGEGHDQEPSLGIMENQEIVSCLLEYKFSFDVWNKFVKRSLYLESLATLSDQFLNQHLVYYEDIAQTFTNLYKANIYATLDYVGYKYYRWLDSACVEANLSIYKKIHEIKSMITVFGQCKTFVKPEQKNAIDKMMIARYNFIIPETGIPNKYWVECTSALLKTAEQSNAENIFPSIVNSPYKQMEQAYNEYKNNNNTPSISAKKNILLLVYGQTDKEILEISNKIKKQNKKCNIFIVTDSTHSNQNSTLSSSFTVINIAPNGLYRYKNLSHIAIFRNIDIAVTLPLENDNLDIGDSIWLGICNVPVINYTSGMNFK